MTDELYIKLIACLVSFSGGLFFGYGKNKNRQDIVDAGLFLWSLAAVIIIATFMVSMLR